jgi:multidrug efflux pump subunit AcrA (membrane-fusion protein)
LFGGFSAARDDNESANAILREGKFIMKKRTKWIVIGSVCAAVIIFAAYAGMQSGVPVQTVSASKGGIRAWVDDRAMTTLPLVHHITMPQDGRILPITVKAGESVAKGQIVAQMDASDLKTALAIADARIAEIEGQIAVNEYNKIETTTLAESKQVIAALQAADILSQDVVVIRPGNPVDIYGPSIGAAPIQGTVVRVKPAGFTKVSSLGVDQQRVPVVIAFNRDAFEKWKKEGRTLGLAYRVRVRVYTEEKKNVVKIPRTALFRGADQRWEVFCVRNTKAVRIPVTLGIINDDEAEITQGLKAGDAVVVAPPKALHDGERVTAS